MKSEQKTKTLPLSKLVTIPPKQYASTNIEHDDISLLKNYLPSAGTFEIIERFSAGLCGAKSGRMLSITGPYGSGKSSMAVFLNGLLSAKNSNDWKISHAILKNHSTQITKTINDARIKSETHTNGMIRCIATARREPITLTILRALDDGATTYFGKYTQKHFSKASSLQKSIHDLKNNKIPTAIQIRDIIADLCGHAPVLLLIDEFGKNIEYFTNTETQESDLFLLQELAEMSGKERKIPLFIITMQHMAFEEYAIGASTVQRQEWAKIQGRFEDIPFANSPEQTRLLVSNTIQINKNAKERRVIKSWAKKQSKHMQNIGIDSGFDPDLVASCYPLSPLALEILPELCSRYGQYERTLLSFLSDAGKHTVATFIDENSWQEESIPMIGIDILYDYFITGQAKTHYSSANITRLMEIETIIRDSHGLSDLETRILKTIGILNLIGRSGYLRASQRIIDYAIDASSKQTLKQLEKKSIITYREHSDEYRIWHGTDIDIASNLDIYRKRYQKMSLADMLYRVMSLEPVVAAKHSIETGTMRLFEQRFAKESVIELDENYDGVIIYQTENSSNFQCDKPIITVTAGDTSDLKLALNEVIAIRDILESNPKVTADWVARRELEERLASAEIHLDRTFGNTYGTTAKWVYLKNGAAKTQQGTPSAIASKICDEVYSKTPLIYNEMINKTVLSSQGTAAKRKLLTDMIIHPEKPMFGIEGYGPDRAVYEAIFVKNGIHVPDETMMRVLQDPQNTQIIPVWNAIIDAIKKSKKRITLSDLYHVCKMPPFGMKDGPIIIFVIAIFLIHKNNMALYEHGTYAPAIMPEIAERMIKNPDFYELKYFKSTPSKKFLLQTVIADLKINSKGSVLDVVGHLVRIVSALPPYVKKTKRMDKHTIVVRDTVLAAVEPDTLLFESLPKALGFKSFGSKASQTDIARFSKILEKSTNILQNEFNKTLLDIKKLLLESTGIEERKKLSESASVMLQSVSDNKMKVFLTAVASDILEHDDDWIKYVAMSLTDIPPADWKDDQREMFENNLVEMAKKFKRLASMHFADISDNFVKPSYQVTVTHADGSEHHNVVSLKPDQKKKMDVLANKILSDMKKRGFTDKDLNALIALLSTKST